MKASTKTIVVLTMAAIVLCMLSAESVSAEGDSVSINYLDSSKTILVSGSGSMSDYTKTENLATQYPDAETIIIDDGITKIGAYTVYGSSSLLTINIGIGVTEIGDGAFAKCTKVGKINFDAENCTGPTQTSHIFTATGSGGIGISLVYGDDVKGVSNYLFFEGLLSDMANIVSVSYGNQMTQIGSELSGSPIRSVTMPDNISTIGNNAYQQCKSLSSVTIGTGVTSIGNYAFSSCTSLTTIIIPEGVTSIGEGCFSKDTSMKSATISSTVTSVGSDAFNGCTALSNVDMGASVISEQMFANCSKLTDITISDKVTGIGSYAFRYSGLTDITIPDSVSSIGDNVFEGCQDLTTVYVGKGVGSIGDNVFNGCRKIANLTINTASDNEYLWGYGNNFNNIGTDGNGATVILGDDVKVVPIFPSSAKVVSVTIGKNVEKFPYKPAFKGCTSLNTVIFNAANCADPNEYSGQFSNCAELDVTIGDSVNRIPAYLFDKGVDKAPKIISLKVSKNVSEVGTKAFGSIKFTDKDGNSINADAAGLAGKTFAGDGTTLSVVTSGSKEAEKTDITFDILAILCAALIIGTTVIIAVRKLQ